MGDISASPDAAVFDARDAARLGGVRAAAPRPAAPAPKPAGSDTSSRLPPTSTTIRSRSCGSAASPVVPCQGSIVLSNSVSIQRVCTENGCPSAGADAGADTTAAGDGGNRGGPPAGDT